MPETRRSHNYNLVMPSVHVSGIQIPETRRSHNYNIVTVKYGCRDVPGQGHTCPLTHGSQFENTSAMDTSAVHTSTRDTSVMDTSAMDTSVRYSGHEYIGRTHVSGIYQSEFVCLLVNVPATG